ncbi:MAG: amidohydrolase family protein [Christensenellales bacterium]
MTEGDTIRGIAPWSQEDTLREYGYNIVDYSECFAMPGMIDSHVHTILPGNGTPAEDFIGALSAGQILLTAARNANTALRSGITTMRDCGAVPDIIFELKNAVDKGIVEGADIIACGSSLTTTAGHTWFFGGECDTEEQIVEKIRENHKRGADFVKLIATGGGTKNVIQYSQMLSDGQIRAACSEAHRLGKMATAHVCTTQTAKAAVHNGVDMIEHMIWADEHNTLKMDYALAEEIAKKDIPICITMSVLPVSIATYEKLGRPLNTAEQAEHDMLCRFRDTIYEGFRQTYQTIRYIPGTDAGWRRSAFDTLVECIVPMAELGMSNLEVLYSATGMAAKTIGADRIGMLCENKRADFVLLKASPIDNIRNVSNIKAVFKKGNRIMENI